MAIERNRRKTTGRVNEAEAAGVEEAAVGDATRWTATGGQAERARWDSLSDADSVLLRDAEEETAAGAATEVVCWRPPRSRNS